MALGSQISEKPNPIVPVQCNTKNISFVTLTFKDENNKLVSFNGEMITCLLVIEQL